MYPEIMVIPMREELTRLGIKELRTVAEVDQAIPNQSGTTMVVVNSICGCAAGRMRPAVRAALQHSARPEKMFSVFAGQDKEATDRARSYFTGISAFVPVDCVAAGWQSGSHDASQRHRTSRGGRHCAGIARVFSTSSAPSRSLQLTLIQVRTEHCVRSVPELPPMEQVGHANMSATLLTPFGWRGNVISIGHGFRSAASS